MNPKRTIAAEIILSSESITDYINLFDSSDSDTVIELLRNFHRENNKKTANSLVKQLDMMLDNYVASIPAVPADAEYYGSSTYYKKSSSYYCLYCSKGNWKESASVTNEMLDYNYAFTKIEND